MGVTDTADRPSLAEIVEDLDATVHLVLSSRHGDEDSVIWLPVWMVQAVAEAARAAL